MSDTTMRAIIVKSYGGPEVLETGEAARPAPGDGQVLVRLAATGVNFSETERRRAVYATPKLPWIPGAEGAGVVEAVGRGADASLVGRRVASRYLTAPTWSSACGRRPAGAAWTWC